MRYSQTQKPPLGSQINWAHPLSKGLVGCWLMNEGSGGKVNDVAMKNYATLLNGYSWAQCQEGKAVTFDGSSGYASVAKDIVSGKKTGSVSVNFISDSFADSTGLVSNRDNAAAHDFLQMKFANYNGYNRIHCAVDDTSEIGIYSPAISDNVSYKFVFTWDSSYLRCYTNNIPSIPVASSSQYPGVASRTLKFASYYDGRFANCKINNVYIWDRALSAQEVAQLYQSPYAMFERRPYWMNYVAAATGNRRRRQLIAGVYR